MEMIRPDLRTLRILSGEGQSYIYNLLKTRRLFLFIKCLVTTYYYFKGSGASPFVKNIVFLNGKNHFRYHKYANRQLENEFGPIQVFSKIRIDDLLEHNIFPRISFLSALQQFKYLVLMLASGRKRYLNLYLISFAVAMEKIVDTHFSKVKIFICYNDQPYDMAAIVHALNKKKCRTIVIQHGLILDYKFYFPSVAKEFWAWGQQSVKYYKAWTPLANIIVKGRYDDDINKKNNNFIFPQNEVIKVLIAPSHFHTEVKQIISKIKNLKSLSTSTTDKKIKISIRFHPATKLSSILKFWCIKTMPLLTEEKKPIEEAVDIHDILITRNSSSGVDFLLRGKPVYFDKKVGNSYYPSAEYCLSISNIFNVPSDSDIVKLNNNRLLFLRESLNV